MTFQFCPAVIGSAAPSQKAFWNLLGGKRRNEWSGVAQKPGVTPYPYPLRAGVESLLQPGNRMQAFGAPKTASPCRKGRHPWWPSVSAYGGAKHGGDEPASSSSKVNRTRSTPFSRCALSRGFPMISPMSLSGNARQLRGIRCHEADSPYSLSRSPRSRVSRGTSCMPWPRQANASRKLFLVALDQKIFDNVTFAHRLFELGRKRRVEAIRKRRILAGTIPSWDNKFRHADVARITACSLALYRPVPAVR
jgi:hypothetical protein